jgi:hypothetical protein
MPTIRLGRLQRLRAFKRPINRLTKFPKRFARAGYPPAAAVTMLPSGVENMTTFANGGIGRIKPSLPTPRARSPMRCQAGGFFNGSQQE